jgi:putative phosphoribosyl transferase
VLGIPRGGVPVAAAVAREIGAPLDVVVAHKLGAPGQPELAIGAVAADGTVLIEPWGRELVGGDEAYLRRAAEDEIARARRREQALRRGRPAVDLRGRTAIVVDDGIATGATMHVAVLAAKAAGATKVIVASPVGAAESVARLRSVADEVVVLATPEPFYAVGEFYLRFGQVDDEEVAALLAAGARPAGHDAAPESGAPPQAGPGRTAEEGQR